MAAAHHVPDAEAAKEPAGSCDHQQEAGDANDRKLCDDSGDDQGEAGENGQETVDSTRGCPVPGPSVLELSVQVRVGCGQFLFELFKAPALFI